MSSIVSALQSLGSDIGNVFGGGNNNLAGGNMASAQFGTPFGNPNAAALQGAFQGGMPAAQGPATPAGGTQTGATPNTQSPVNMSQIGRLYLQYMMAKQLQRPQFIGGHSTPMTPQPPFNPFGATPAAIMPPQVQL